MTNPSEAPVKGAELTLTDFLLARIAEDERAARKLAETDRRPVLSLATTVNHPDRILLECEAKRRIIELHRSWPVLVETPPTFEQAGSDADSMTFRMSQQIQWQTQQEYVARFGSEPPSAPMMRALALPYADHPDFRDEWRP